MPLRDHFQPPLNVEEPWEGLHGMWPATIVQHLNESVLNRRYKSIPNIHIGAQIEVDIGTFDREPDRPAFDTGGSGGGVAVEIEKQTYAPPAPPLVADASFTDTDVYEVQVYRLDGRRRLVAAIELVSPANKDRPETRAAFVAKCASLLAERVSVVVVDMVTSRHADLHAELCDFLHLPTAFDWRSPTRLSAVSYRTLKAKEKTPVRVDGWPFPLTVGESLPTVPLWLASDLAVPLELELTYAAACKALRIE